MLKAIYRLAKLDGCAHRVDLAGALCVSPGIARQIYLKKEP